MKQLILFFHKGAEGHDTIFEEIEIVPPLQIDKLFRNYLYKKLLENQVLKVWHSISQASTFQQAYLRRIEG